MTDIYSQLQQLAYRYLYEHDAQNAEGAAACFATDAQFIGCTGREAIKERLSEIYAGQKWPRRHSLSNFLVDEHTDTTAHAFAYEILYLLRDGGVEAHCAGIWSMDAVVEDGVWKIQHTEVRLDTSYEPGDTNVATVQDAGRTVIGRV